MIKKERQGATIVETGVAVAGGAGGAALGTGVAVGLGLTGVAVGAVATGGALVVGGAAVYGIHKGMQAIDHSAYGAEDERFKANLSSKTHMVGITGRFFTQLPDPETGHIDFRNTGTVNRYANLFQRHITNKSGLCGKLIVIPRWMRGGDGVCRQQAARAEIQIARAARRS